MEALTLTAISDLGPTPLTRILTRNLILPLTNSLTVSNGNPNSSSYAYLQLELQYPSL